MDDNDESIESEAYMTMLGSDLIVVPKSTKLDFKHVPLDHSKLSFRLIQVLPQLSIHGYIQCTLRHMILDPLLTYKCLSYVWGTECRRGTIILNGQYFRVRLNLLMFLEFARIGRFPGCWLWIDAMCIDQTNVNERNHQVQQMGLIYSNAIEVISWLGDDEMIAKHFKEVGSETDPASPGPLSPSGWQALFNLDYWNRAWITQEVALARKVTLMASAECLLITQLPWRFYATQSLHENSTAALYRPMSRFEPHETIGKYRRSLIRLLLDHMDAGCAFPRDRIFSLLSLCNIGSDLQVDYAISDEELAIKTFQACGNVFCLCSMQIVGRALRLQDADLQENTKGDRPFAKFVLPRKVPQGQVSDRLEFECGWAEMQIATWTSTGSRAGAAKYKIDVNRWRGIDTTSLSEIDALRWDEGTEVVFFTMDLGKLCSGRQGVRVWIETRRGNFPISDNRLFYQCSHQSEPNSTREKFDSICLRYNGVQIKLSEDLKKCTVTFSVRFLLELSRLPGGHAVPDPCPRVLADTLIGDDEYPLRFQSGIDSVLRDWLDSDVE